MNVIDFTIATKSLIKQLEKYGFVKGEKLNFDLDYFDEVIISKNKAYYQVKSHEDVLDILAFFNFEPKVLTVDIDKIIAYKDLNIAMGISLILQIEKVI